MMDTPTWPGDESPHEKQCSVVHSQHATNIKARKNPNLTFTLSSNVVFVQSLDKLVVQRPVGARMVACMCSRDISQHFS